MRAIHEGLVPVYESDDNRQVVDARELHGFLESGRQFGNWIEDRLGKYGFVEDEDYVLVFNRSGKNPSGGRPTKDYLLTMEVAKELCMVENNEKGRQARRYFIECERKLRSQETPHQIPQTYAEALMLAGRLEEERAALASRIERDLPRVLFAEAVETSTTAISVGELSKLLAQNGIEMGRNRLFQWFRNNGYVFKTGTTPTQRAIEMGIFELKENVITKPDGSTFTTMTTMVTGKGQIFFLNKFLREKMANGGLTILID